MAKTLSPEEEALQMTQQLLFDPKQRPAVINGSSQAQAADRALQSLAGDPQTAQQMYQLAADIFGSMGQQNGFDADKMEKVVEQGAKDPAGFANTLSPGQKDMLHKLGLAIEQKRAVH